jgi:hypothetical protein
MEREAVALRSRSYRERRIADASRRGETVTHEALIEAASELRDGAREMHASAREMRQAAAEMRRGGAH